MGAVQKLRAMETFKKQKKWLPITPASFKQQ